MNQNQTTDNLAVSHIKKAHTWRMAFFGLIILVAGIVIGGSSMLVFATKKPKPRAPEFASVRMVGQLHRELRLTPEQTEKIKPILKEHMETLHNIRIDAQDQIGEALEQMNKQVSSILTDRQKQMWQKRLRHLQSPLRGGGGGPGWGEGPGGGRFRGGQQDRPRRGPGPGPFGPRRRPADPNTPQDGPAEPPEEPPE